jgi:hypothetical protein
MLVRWDPSDLLVMELLNIPSVAGFDVFWKHVSDNSCPIFFQECTNYLQPQWNSHYRMLIDTRADIIQFYSSCGPGHGLPSLPASSRTSPPLPALRHLSDVAFISWIICLKLDTPMNQLIPPPSDERVRTPKLFIRRNVQNEEAFQMLAYNISIHHPHLMTPDTLLEIETNPSAVKKYVPEYPGVAFACSEHSLDRLNACPAGFALSYFLMDHKKALGDRFILDVTVFMTAAVTGELTFVYRTAPWPEDLEEERSDASDKLQEWEIRRRLDEVARGPLLEID